MTEQTADQTPIRVMLVDDHKSVLWGLERLVESAQPRMAVVGTASTCAELLSKVVSAKPDIILLDLDLNGENSFDALPELLQLTEAKVLLLTGSRDSSLLQASVLHGVRGVVGKDESADVVLRAIERVHAGEVWINRAMMGKLLDAMSSGAGKGGEKDPEAAKIASLTPREREIIRAVVNSQGEKSLAIADTLHISEHTLRNHLTLIYEKLGVRNRLGLFAYAVKHGLAES
ncbi:response regulator transcription factor [Propionivibrio limicola]|uniref:response regulator transcription factor n=1 Tax=Propionivibrio limicola TaxID=167645 RepID=UPI001291450D|nr:response regulator transcription factor [Propionivibrio limicola]